MNTNTPKDKLWLKSEIERVFGPAGAHADIFLGMILNPCPSQPSPSKEEIEQAASEVVSMLDEFGRAVDAYEYGLPVSDDECLLEMNKAVCEKINWLLNKEGGKP
jgi:hypothetical protein